MNALDLGDVEHPAATTGARDPAPLADVDLPLFNFEADYAKSLCCMPMIVRYKLDACRIKLALPHWQRFDHTTRRLLIVERLDAPAGQRRYRHLLLHAIVHQAKAQPSRMPARAALTDWDSRLLPERVRQSALNKGLALDGPRRWADLGSLQRYTLFKLTRPGHENRNFRLALEEFGLRKTSG